MRLIFFVLFMLVILSGKGQGNMFNYFDCNEKYYKKQDSLKYQILSNFLKGTEKCLKTVSEPVLIKTGDISFRIIYLPYDTVRNYPFISRIWAKQGNYYKRDIVFKVNFNDSNYYEIDKIVLDTMYEISQKKFKKILKKVSFLNPSSFYTIQPVNVKDTILEVQLDSTKLKFWVQQITLPDLILEFKTSTYQCLCMQRKILKKYNKEIRQVFPIFKPYFKNEYEKRQFRSQYIELMIIIVLSSLISNLL